jgi:hypothetical protein
MRQPLGVPGGVLQRQDRSPAVPEDGDRLKSGMAPHSLEVLELGLDAHLVRPDAGG